MTVERTQLGCQTRYTLREGAALSCTLTFGGCQGSPPEWKILLPGPDGSRRLEGMHLFAAPVAVRLGAWLAPLIGPDRAAELADAVGARPPRLPEVPRHAPTVGLTIPRQRDYRA